MASSPACWRGVETAKRYVLFISSEDLSQAEVDSFAEAVGRRAGAATVIQVKGTPRALIVKTTNAGASLLRGDGSGLPVGAKRLVSVLTSGAIGNLKKRVPGAAANGKVP